MIRGWFEIDEKRLSKEINEMESRFPDFKIEVNIINNRKQLAFKGYIDVPCEEKYFGVYFPINYPFKQPRVGLLKKLNKDRKFLADDREHINKDYSICLYPSDGGPHSWRYYYTAADALDKLQSYYKNKEEDLEYFEHMSENLDFPGIAEDGIVFIPSQIIDFILENEIVELRLLKAEFLSDLIYWVNYVDEDYYNKKEWSFLNSLSFEEFPVYGIKQTENTSSFKEKAYEFNNLCEFINSYFNSQNGTEIDFNKTNVLLVNKNRNSVLYRDLNIIKNKGKPPNEKEYILGKNITLPDSIFTRAKVFLGEAFSVLRYKTVLFVGLGTLGSRIAEEMVKSGIKKFILYDFDRLKPENICRHTGSLPNLGMKKVEVVRNQIFSINPFCYVETYDVNPVDGENAKKFIENLIHSDLVIISTGNYESEMFTNKLATRYKKNVIYCYADENVNTGEIFYYDPPKGPCYECLQSNLDAEANPEISKVFKILKRVDKSRPLPGRSYYEDTGVPGISIDINFIALLASKLAITKLSEEIKDFSDFYSIFPKDRNFFYWNNRGDLLNFGIHSLNVMKVPECNFCSTSGRVVKLFKSNERKYLKKAIRHYSNRKLDSEKNV